jgi:hypothetical protein
MREGRFRRRFSRGASYAFLRAECEPDDHLSPDTRAICSGIFDRLNHGRRQGGLEDHAQLLALVGRQLADVERRFSILVSIGIKVARLAPLSKIEFEAR